MIICIVVTERNERSGNMEQIVSHGIDSDTGRHVVLPCDPPGTMGAVFDREMGEYVIRDEPLPNKVRPSVR